MRCGAGPLSKRARREARIARTERAVALLVRRGVDPAARARAEAAAAAAATANADAGSASRYRARSDGDESGSGAASACEPGSITAEVYLASAAALPEARMRPHVLQPRTDCTAEGVAAVKHARSGTVLVTIACVSPRVPASARLASRAARAPQGGFPTMPVSPARLRCRGCTAAAGASGRRGPLQGAVVDTTGAGDAFVGGLLYGLCQGLPPERMLALAAAVAAAKCTALGARRGLPLRDAVRPDLL